MKKMLDTSLGYMIAGICAGVFYREFTKFNGFTGQTALKSVHPHLLVLGMLLFLVVALFVKVLPSLDKEKNFRRFYVTYNVALPFMAVMLIVRGAIQVLQTPLSSGLDASIAGLAGIAHILMTVALVFLFLALRKAAAADRS